MKQVDSATHHSEDAEKIEQLVAEAKKRNQSSFMKLYSMYYKELYAYACYMLRHPQDAEDAVADTVMAAYEGIKKLRDNTRFRQWIFKILSNQCKHRRKEYAENWRRMEQPVHRLRGGAETEGEEQERQWSDGSDMAQDIAQREWVQQAFAVLTEEETYIVNSFIFAELKGEEVAESLGMVSSTVRSKYRRALQKMRKYLEE